MRYFPADYWNDPDKQTVHTPVGEACLHCEEPIRDGDPGMLMPHFDGESARERPYHRECMLRGVVGSVGHQLKRCSCRGGQQEDPPFLSRRRQALAAVFLFERSWAGLVSLLPSNYRTLPPEEQLAIETALGLPGAWCQ